MEAGIVKVRRCLLVAIILTTLINRGLCQQSLSGYLTDSVSGKPISGASIVCTGKSSSKVLKFGITDVKGRFGFTINEPGLDSFVLKISHIGFRTEVVVLRNNTAELRVRLVRGAQILTEVTLRAIDNGVYRKKDTVNYVADSFADKNDRVLADVIHKLPGIEVVGNQIFYQGKALQKFYVDGLDLMRGRYGIINNNLPLEGVQKVQIIEDDQPVKVLDSLIPSNRASLNVVLRKHATTGSGSIGLGMSPLLWNLSLTPMSFYKNFQMVNTVQANNTGNPVSNQLRDQMFGTQGTDFSSDKYVSVTDAGHPPLDEPQWLQNNVKMFSSNLLYKAKSNVQWRGNLTYINDVQSNHSYNKTTMVLPDQSVTVTESIQDKYYINSFSGGVALEKNEKNIFLADQLAVDEKWNSNKAWDNRDDTTNITQLNNERLTDISNVFDLTMKIGKQLVGINSSTSYKTMPETLLVSPGQFSGVLNKGVAYDQADQQVHFDYFTTDNHLGFVKKIQSIVFDLKTGFLFESCHLKSQLETNANQAIPDSLKNNAAFLHSRTYLDANFHLVKSNWLFNLETPLSWQVFANAYNLETTISPSTRKLTLDPVFWVIFKPSFHWMLSGSVGYKNDFGSQGSLYKGYLLQSFSTLSRSQAGFESQGNTLSYNFYSTYEDVLKAWFSNLSVSYSKSYSNLISETNIDSLGLSINEIMPTGNNYDLFGTVLNLSKYFNRIKSIIKLKGSLNNGYSDQYLNDSFTRLRSTTIGFSVNALNSFLGWLNFEYKFDYSHTLSAYPGGELNPVTGMNHTLKLDLFPAKNESFTATTSYFSSRPYVQSNKWLMNLKYMVTLPKTKTDLSVTVSNILNAPRYVNQYNAGYTTYYNELYLRPRQVLFGVRFNFK